MKPTILVVDDDQAVRESLSNVLMEENYAVISAANGSEALDLLTMREVALIVLDLNMPVKNGWETFEQLYYDHPLIPVIIITAKPNQVLISMASGAGALLEKPFEIPHLLRTIHRLLAESAESRLQRIEGSNTDFFYFPARILRAS